MICLQLLYNSYTTITFFQTHHWIYFLHVGPLYPMIDFKKKLELYRSSKRIISQTF
jgi:hypothetical protein